MYQTVIRSTTKEKTMQINMAYYDNNPVEEIILTFRNFVEGFEGEKRDNPLLDAHAEMIFYVDTRSLHTVGMDTFCRWKLGMSEEVARETYHWERASFDSDQHVGAECKIDSEGKWYDV